MNPQQTSNSGRPTARWGRLIAAASCLLALAAMAIPGAAQAVQAPSAFTSAELARAERAVLAADVAGTAWGVDPATGTVRVLADETVSAAEIGRVRRGAGDLSPALTITRTPGELRTFLQGGEPIYSTAGRCAAGFNGTAGGQDVLITAGHCTSAFPTWYADSAGTALIGPTAASSFPGNDYGLIRYVSSLSRPGTVICNGQVIDIIGARNPTIGETLWVAAPTGCTSGGVTALNLTINYGGADIVHGLGRLTACTEPGSSGAPVFTMSGYAVGIVSGGSGNCSTGGTTYFQPILEILNAYGVTLT
ncbi:S1 family peptidase [Streptomyces sp. SBT349]|uniref:S1 family peptidase n=1 Tax=Streptomyces sp. SBT349 TaxID=1580539 RepID=UPI00066EBB82|nr:S1 family peptidase [Streptomyces sp. SBT349]